MFKTPRSAIAQGEKMERNFTTVVKNIMAILPESSSEKLLKSAQWWAPEIRWVELARFVNENVIPSSTDPMAIAAYAELCNKNYAEMVAEFKSKGL